MNEQDKKNRLELLKQRGKAMQTIELSFVIGDNYADNLAVAEQEKGINFFRRLWENRDLQRIDIARQKNSDGFGHITLAGSTARDGRSFRHVRADHRAANLVASIEMRNASRVALRVETGHACDGDNAGADFDAGKVPSSIESAELVQVEKN